MTPEEKNKYYQMASQSPPTLLSGQFNKRHETQRVVNNLRDSVRNVFTTYYFLQVIHVTNTYM